VLEMLADVVETNIASLGQIGETNEAVRRNMLQNYYA
jgi:hypothetical protein